MPSRTPLPTAIEDLRRTVKKWCGKPVQAELEQLELVECTAHSER